MFDGWFGKNRRAAAARRAELRGELGRAIVLFAEAQLPDEAARVMLLRGDGEADPRKRLIHYTQAVDTAPDGHAMKNAAKKKRAALVVALAGDGPLSGTMRQDVLVAAKDLEAVGDQEGAAHAYARAGDIESEARALAQAGDVEKLEFLLFEQHAKEREERKRREAFADVDLLLATGRRREALDAAEALARVPGSEAHGKERAAQLRARRAAGPVAKLTLHGKELALVLGHEVVVGRTEGAVQIASAAVSRKHLVLHRQGKEIFVRDTGSRNGTLLRGLALVGAVPIGDGLELRLGKEVPLRLQPSAAFPFAVEIELAGARYIAPLGPARLPGLDWSIEQAEDGWLELVSDDTYPAMLGEMQLVPRSTLLVGDAIATNRGGVVVLKVAG